MNDDDIIDVGLAFVTCTFSLVDARIPYKGQDDANTSPRVVCRWW
jgi:hypothetical protein